MLKRVSWFCFTAACCGPALAAPPGSGWQLRFADEFLGTGLDTSKWNYNYTWGQTHNHRAYVVPEQVQVGSGVLNLQAIAQRHPSAPSGVTQGGTWYSLDYTSGAINSSGKLNVQYGYIEARMKMPNVKGIWPAFWTLQSGWPPEIDIMEFPLTTDNQKWRYWANYHYTNASNTHASYGGENWVSPDLTAGYHDYAVEWTSTYMKFYFDGGLIRTITDTAAIADASAMYLILNNAVGGWPGDPPTNATFPGNFETDWVRVWQKPAGALTSTWTKATAGNQNWMDNNNWNGEAPILGSMTAVLPTVGVSDVRLDWPGTITVGKVQVDATTNYTIGWPDDLVTLADQSGRAAIEFRSTTGNGVHSLKSRIEAYNNTSLRNYTTRNVPIDGALHGQAEFAFENGTFTLNSAATHEGGTFIDAGGDLTINGSINTPGDEVVVGRTAGNAGTLRVNATGVITATSICAGAGTGTLVLNGGTLRAGADSATFISGMTSATLQATSIIDTNGKSITIPQVLSGAGGLARHGTGSLTLSGNNSYGGPTTINAGLLYLGHASALGSTSAGTTIAAGARLYLISALTIAEPLTISSDAGGSTALQVGGGSSAKIWSGPITLASNATIKLDGSVNFTASGAMSGSGGTLTLRGDGGSSGTIAGNISLGAGGVTVIGNTWALTGTNTFSGPITIQSGRLNLSPSALPAAGNMLVVGGQAVAQTAGVYRAASLSIADGASATISAGADKVLNIGGLFIGATGKLELANNDMIVRGGSLSAITALLTSGRAGGAWNGSGIASSSAGTAPRTALGVLLNNNGAGQRLMATLAGQDVALNDVLVKYTWEGDANFDGIVSIDDYFLIDTGYARGRTGWSHGDFNYSGGVTGDDYFLIDRAFLWQTGPLAEAPSGTPAVLPEPAVLAMMGVTVGLLRPRRRPAITRRRPGLDLRPASGLSIGWGGP